MSDATNLSGKLLIAMPGMSDPRFDKSVVFLCLHSNEGTMGIVINKPADELSFDDMLEQLEIPSETNSSDHHLFFGGPVETGRGFVLHSGDYSGQDGTLRVNDFFAMTATRDILQDIANGQGPDQVLPALGYAGWGPGQLEGEIQQNAWLTVDADQAIVFSKENKSKWEAALAKLGISPLMLSAEGGRA